VLAALRVSLVALLALLVFAPLARADSSKVILKTIGSTGSEASQFTGATSPGALAVNGTGAGGVAAGDFYVLDTGNRRIQEFSKTGSFIRMWGKEVDKTPGTTHPDTCTAVNITAGDTCGAAAAVSGAAGAITEKLGGIAIDQANGNVYVTNPTQHRVDVFTAAGIFEGAFGWGVKTGDTVATGLDFCTSISGCQTGFGGEKGGQFNATGNTTPRGIAVDPRNAHLLVADSANLRIEEFAPMLSGAGEEVTGISFVKALGWDVVSSGPDNANQIENLIVKATGGKFHLSFGGQTTADLEYNSGAAEVQAALQALPNIGAGNVQVTGGPGDVSGSRPYAITFVGALKGQANGPVTAATGTPALAGTVSVPAPMNVGGAAQFEVCTPSDVCKPGTPGAGAGQLSGGAVSGNNIFTELAVDSTGTLYMLTAQESACSATEKICRVQKFSPSGLFAREFAEAQLRFTSGTTTGRAHSLAVRPSDDHVFVSKHVAAAKYEVGEFDSSGALVASSPAKPTEELKSNSTVAGPIGVGPEERLYFGTLTNKQIYILIPVPAAVPSKPTCGSPTATAVTCSGTVTIPSIESGGVATSYRFEYSTDGVTWTRYPFSDVEIGQTPGLTPVGPQTIHPLSPSTLYQIRLCATTASTVCSEALVLTTVASAPTISEMFIEEVTQTEATLGAKINPQHQKTSYHFEWGTTTAYGNRIPTFERQIGSGSTSIAVQDPIGGLRPRTIYHYRVVTTNGTGTIFGPDHEFETLNSCGLLDNRCYELVSPADKGSVAAVKQDGLGADMQLQAAVGGSAIAYSIAAGLPNSTAGTEVLYRASRGATGWSSSQISPPALISSQMRGGSSQSSRTRGLAGDLSCGAVVSPEPLTSDTPAFTIEAGGANLYRRGENGTYTVISYLPPSNTEAANIISLEDLEAEEYQLIGMSQDCSRVIFRSRYIYPGIPGVGTSRLYEWDEGKLHNVGVILGSSGATVAGATPGALSAETGAEPGLSEADENYWHAVSEDGSRVFFTAISQFGGDIGNRAVFLRDDGAMAIDVSQSQTATTAKGAYYQTASKDGSRVFFLANYGLTTTSSIGATTGSCATALPPVRCDLYEYNLNASVGQRLTDLSVDTVDPEGAVVAGVLDTSENGSYVYFAARGQLVAGKGSTYAENVSAGTYSVYLAHGGATKFVGAVRAGDFVNKAGVLLSRHNRWTSRSTPDGTHLLFNSTANVTGYASGGAIEAYLYSAASESTECISCRHDEQSSVAGSTFSPLASETSGSSNSLHPPVDITADGSRVYFISPDRLATGAIEGQSNLYGWEHGQAYLLATEPVGLFEEMKFAGVSAIGDDVFLTTPTQLNFEDVDGRPDVYDARVNGGFPVPSPPPVPCDPLSENSCQASPAADTGANGSAPASSLPGSGNQAAPKHKSKKKHHKNKKKHHKNKKKHSKRDHARHANTGRGIGK
jgi:hypothetical protein